MLPRVFLADRGGVDKEVAITGEDGHHFARVLRVEPGEELVVALTDGPWLGKIAAVSAQTVTVRLSGPYRAAEPAAQLTLVQGIAKGDKMETIVQKGTEIGAAAFVVYQADRSVVKLQGKVDNKLARWRKVAREAAMQSQRDKVPPLAYATDLSRLCQDLLTAGVSHFIVLDEAETATGLITALRQSGTTAAKRALFVGPEGGWSERERACLSAFATTSLVTLGPRILRTETAGAAALAATLAHFGDMGG